MEDESSDADGASEYSSSACNHHSEDSRNSNDSFLYHNEDHMDGNSYDGWDSDFCYTTSENESKFESHLETVLDVTEEQRDQENMSELVEINDETLEENNNDPNNNMGPIEMIDIEEEGATGPSFDATANRSTAHCDENHVVHLDRGDSPKPGCSKDPQPTLQAVPHESLKDDTILEKTRHILSLVSKIHRDSIYDALCTNEGVPISELKLWDLLPANERLAYLDISSKKKELLKPSSFKPEKSSEPVINIAMHTQWATSSDKCAKRLPTNDICTVQTKKSLSDPDLSILAPTVPPPAIPSLPSTSQTANLPTKPNVHRGAIPKVRDEPSNRNRQHASIPPKPEQHRRAQLPMDHVIMPWDKTPYLHHPRNKCQGIELPAHQNRGHTIPKAPVVNHVPVVRAVHAPSVTVNPSKVTVRAPVLKYLATRPVSTKPNTAVIDTSKPVRCQVEVVHAVVPTVAPVTNQPRKNEREKEKEKQPTPAAQQQQPAAAQQEQPVVQQQNAQRAVCMEMYYKLIVIFPNVDPEYVKKLCPPDWGPGDRDAQLAPLVEHLLERGDSLPQVPINRAIDTAEPNVSYSSVDDIYENLLGIFPDADPHYLRDFAVKNIGNSDEVKNFVHSKLERRDYPTREQYMARLKITEQQRQYTTGFDVKQFLSIIPDPSKHFMDPKRKCTHSTVAFEFLKSYFNRMRVNTISRTYTRCNYNLSATAQTLEQLGPDLKSKRGGSEMPTEDILLLQEIAFVRHKMDINNYIADVKKREDEEFKTLKALNQLLECQCCYDSECLPSKCSHCDNGHVFCNSCIVTGTSAKMGEDQTRIYCFVNCGSEFSLSVLQRVLIPTTFSILLKKRQAAEVMEAGLEGLVSCPFCHFASIPPEGDKIFRCLNPECTKESCRLCKELSHVPLKCDEVMKADNARRFIEEKMTQAIARKCYKCQRAFFKEEGCNKITCPCGAQMCYLCDQPIKDYTHFRGQGSNDTKLCPLYSDTIRLDAVAVRKVAEQAQLQVLKRNPNIKIDTTNLLPAIPLARRGPHDDVLNADELPRRAQRVLDLPPL